MNKKIKQEFLDITIEYLIENYLVDEIMLNETTVRITRKATLSRSTGAAVGTLAKNDPMYKRMITFRDKYKELKEKLKKKYASKAKALARKRASKK